MTTGMRIAHVGIVARDLPVALASFGDLLGVPAKDRTTFEAVEPETGEIVDAGFLNIGENRIGLICPGGSTSRMATHLEKRGESLFHLAVWVDDFEAAVRLAAECDPTIDVHTVRMTPPLPGDEPAAMRQGPRIAWVPPALTYGVNVELIDANSPRVRVEDDR
jgi:catechol 2,3-dioxygenase-like lactoylglutathione lyase family enzyme